MTPGKYRTIVADPPWSFRSAATKADARKHYGTMRLDDICGLRPGGFAAGGDQSLGTAEMAT